MKYDVRLVPVVRSSVPVTKLDALNAKRDALMRELYDLHRTIEGLAKTPCNLTCEGCGTVLPTEADFAAHFVIPHVNLINDFLNLAECPKADK
jgi:hypothetical protein